MKKTWGTKGLKGGFFSRILNFRGGKEMMRAHSSKTSSMFLFQREKKASRSFVKN